MNQISASFTIGQLSFAASFFILIYSIMTLINVIIKFRKPFNIKFNFIVLILCIGLSNYFQLIQVDYYTHKVLNFVIKAFFTISFLQLITNLFFPHFKKFVNILSITIIVFASASIISVIINHYPAISKSNLVYYNEISPYNEGIKVPLIIDLFRFVFSIIYISTILYFCYQIIINFNHNNIYFKKIKYFTYAIVGYIMLLLSFFVLRQFLALYHSYLNVFISFTLDLLILLIISNRPEFLNRSAQKLKLIYRFLPAKQFLVDSINFNTVFFNQMYFLDKEAKVDNFAKLINVSKDDVANYVQNEFGMDFDDLLNKNRIEYFIQLVRQPAYQNLTIDALAKEVGFVSRNAFYKPFKKFHGGNPSDLIDFNS